MTSIRIALAGGGTGGHVVPGLHLLAHARAGLEPAWARLVWFGTGRQAERAALGDLAAKAEPIEGDWTPLGLEARSGGAPARAAALVRALPATWTARRRLRRERVNVVVGLGGLVQLPVVLAARSLGIPVLLLEVNAVMGTTTRRLAPLASQVLHAWRASLPGGEEGERHRFTGPPLAPEFALDASARAALGRAARERHGVAPDQPLVLVLGGSQGAAGLNRFVVAERSALLAGGAFVLHQVGPGRLDEAAAEYPNYRAAEYFDDVPALLAAARLVLCRGGASTLAEVAAARVPAWVVPYPHHADQQQERNARELGRGVEIVRESELGPATAKAIGELTAPSAAADGRLAAMAGALEAAVPRDAARRILEAVAAAALAAEGTRS